MNAIPYLLMLILVAAFQALLRPFSSFFGISINLPMLLVLMVAWRKTELLTLWFACGVAIVASAGTPLTMGWQVLFTAAIAVAVFYGKGRLNADSLAAQLSVLFAGVFVHNACTLVIERADNLPYQLWRTAMGGAVYTLALVAVVFYLRDYILGLTRKQAASER
ncbi:MAG: hypothetical protein AB1644_03910 [Candidatus Zixiibacteriota bacterium]